MRSRTKLLKTCLLIAVGFLFALTSLAAAERLKLANSNSFGLVSKAEIGNVSRRLMIQAVGPASVSGVYATVGGILFQATASPDETLQGKPITIEFRESEVAAAKLRVSVGNQQAVSPAPAWIWVKAAQFASSDYTAAVTLFSDPVTPDEKRFDARHNCEYWIAYNPVLDDSLIGFLLFTADGMFVEDNPNYLRKITASVSGLSDHLGYIIEFDETKSHNAATTFRSFLRPIAWETYMLNDINTKYTISISEGVLVIDGTPKYHFGKMTGTTFSEIQRVRQFFDNNTTTLHEINPIVYTAAFDFARHVAFFNYVKEQDKESFEEFVDSLTGLTKQLPSIETPAVWNPRLN